MTMSAFRQLMNKMVQQLKEDYAKGKLNTVTALQPLRDYVTASIDLKHENLGELLAELTAIQVVIATLPDATMKSSGKHSEEVYFFDAFIRTFNTYFMATFLASVNQRLSQMPDLLTRMAHDLPCCTFLAQCLMTTPHAFFHVEISHDKGTRHYVNPLTEIEANNQAFILLYNRVTGNNVALFKRELDSLRALKPNATALSLAAFIQEQSPVVANQSVPTFVPEIVPITMTPPLTVREQINSLPTQLPASTKLPPTLSVKESLATISITVANTFTMSKLWYKQHLTSTSIKDAFADAFFDNMDARKSRLSTKTS